MERPPQFETAAPSAQQWGEFRPKFLRLLRRRYPWRRWRRWCDHRSGIEYCILWQADRGVAGMGSWLVHRDFLTHSLTIHSSGWMSSMWWNFFLISLLTSLFYSLSKFCTKGKIKNSNFQIEVSLGGFQSPKVKVPSGIARFPFFITCSRAIH